MKQLYTIFYGLLALVIIAIAAWVLTSKAVSVQVAEVKRGVFHQVVEENGKTRVRDRYVIASPVSGTIRRVALKAGDAVERDAVVATIEPNPPELLDARSIKDLTERVGAAQATRSRAVADQAKAQATLNKARTDLDRYKILARDGFISSSQLAQYELSYQVSLRELDAANEAFKVAEHELGSARAALLSSQQRSTGDQQWPIRSPVAGTVLKVMQESQSAVQLGAPLMEIGDPTRIEIVVDVLSSDAVQIKSGDAVTLQGWGQSESLQGRVRRVEPSAFTKISALGVEEQRVNIIIDLISAPPKWEGLSDGFRVVADIITFSDQNALIVPTGALIKAGEQWIVYVVEGGRTKERTVTIARRSGLDAMVEKGLQPGEKVVVYPGDLVKDGVRVRVKE
jgi:HlyD family secretion protein